MGAPSRVKRKMAAMRAVQAMKKRLELPLSEELKTRLDDETEEGVWLGPVSPLPAAVHWEEDATDDEEEDCEYSDEESDCGVMSETQLQLGQESQTNIFTDMMQSATRVGSPSKTIG